MKQTGSSASPVVQIAAGGGAEFFVAGGAAEVIPLARMAMPMRRRVRIDTHAAHRVDRESFGFAHAR
jgi:hypothetical protein